VATGDRQTDRQTDVHRYCLKPPYHHMGRELINLTTGKLNLETAGISNCLVGRTDGSQRIKRSSN